MREFQSPSTFEQYLENFIIHFYVFKGCTAIQLNSVVLSVCTQRSSCSVSV